MKKKAQKPIAVPPKVPMMEKAFPDSKREKGKGKDKKGCK